jgi:DNA-binding NtrC family response regulator
MWGGADHPEKVGYMAQRVLIVEHHLHACIVLYDIFLTAGYECLLASDGAKGLEVFGRAKPDLIVTGVEMPFTSGIELLQQVRQQDPDAAVIVLSGGTDEAAMTSFKLGAFKVLAKPVNMDELLLTAKHALEWRQFRTMHRQALQMQARIPSYVGPTSSRAQEWLSVAENHLSAAAFRYRHCNPEGAAQRLAEALKAINVARSFDAQLDVGVAMKM